MMFYVPYRPIGVALAVLAIWYGIWRVMMMGDVSQIETSLAHHKAAIEQRNPNMLLRYQNVHPTGFPFNSAVAIDHITLRLFVKTPPAQFMEVRLKDVRFEKVNAGEGRYQISLPTTFLADYAEPMKEEHYRVYVNEMPVVLARAQGDSRTCMSMPGTQRCAEVSSNDPLITYAAQMPKYLLLTVQEANLGEEKIEFVPSIQSPTPIFMDIPADLERPLTLFIGMLREALVFRNQ